MILPALVAASLAALPLSAPPSSTPSTEAVDIGPAPIGIPDG